MQNPWQYKIDPYYVARGKVMAIVMDEPSTRTRLSFETAMKRLGGEVLWFYLDHTTSKAKGESVQDALKTISQFADVLVLRHSDPEVIYWARDNLDIHLINAGNGAEEHPTQALLDVYTVYNETKGLARKHFLFCGDLAYSRTIHSVLRLLALYPEIRVTCVTPKERSHLPIEMYATIIQKFRSWQILDNLKTALTSCAPADVLYMTRLQSERMKEDSGYPMLTEETISLLPQHTIILHPLPRQNEMPAWVDRDTRAVSFKQVKYGMHLRMGLLYQIFGRKDDE
jgi:aspartate carbamoyltransferase catalytic subunit